MSGPGPFTVCLAGAVLWAMALLPCWAGNAAAGEAGQPALLDGDGGRAGLTREQVVTIRRARDEVKTLIESPHEPSWIRRDAAAALQRLHEALNDWGRPGQLEWYIARILHARDPQVRRSLISGAMAAAKARQLHFGGVRTFWRKLDTLALAHPDLLAGDVDYDRRYVADAEAGTARAADLIPRYLEPYRLSVPSDLKPNLRPYPEPKE